MKNKIKIKERENKVPKVQILVLHLLVQGQVPLLQVVASRIHQIKINE
jgi:hypothetical protein